MTSTNYMHRASAPGSGRLDLSLAGRRASRRTRSQRVAVVVAHVPPALLRSSSMEVLERPSAQDPAKSGHECLTRGTATMSRSRAHTHTRRWHALRACGGDNQTNQGTTHTTKGFRGAVHKCQEVARSLSRLNRPIRRVAGPGKRHSARGAPHAQPRDVRSAGRDTWNLTGEALGGPRKQSWRRCSRARSGRRSAIRGAHSGALDRP
jgi:hypothetical protein